MLSQIAGMESICDTPLLETSGDNPCNLIVKAIGHRGMEVQRLSIVRIQAS